MLIAIQYFQHLKLVAIWNKLAKAVEDARNTIFCDCEETHYRVVTDIHPSQARSCKRCGIKHPAKQVLNLKHFSEIKKLTCLERYLGREEMAWIVCDLLYVH